MRQFRYLALFALLASISSPVYSSSDKGKEEADDSPRQNVPGMQSVPITPRTPGSEHCSDSEEPVDWGKPNVPGMQSVPITPRTPRKNEFHDAPDFLAKEVLECLSIDGMPYSSSEDGYLSADSRFGLQFKIKGVLVNGMWEAPMSSWPDLKPIANAASWTLDLTHVLGRMQHVDFAQLQQYLVLASCLGLKSPTLKYHVEPFKPASAVESADWLDAGQKWVKKQWSDYEDLNRLMRALPWLRVDMNWGYFLEFDGSRTVFLRTLAQYNQGKASAGSKWLIYCGPDRLREYISDNKDLHRVNIASCDDEMRAGLFKALSGCQNLQEIECRQLDKNDLLKANLTDVEQSQLVTKLRGLRGIFLSTTCLDKTASSLSQALSQNTGSLVALCVSFMKGLKESGDSFVRAVNEMHNIQVLSVMRTDLLDKHLVSLTSTLPSKKHLTWLALAIGPLAHLEQDAPKKESWLDTSGRVACGIGCGILALPAAATLIAGAPLSAIAATVMAQEKIIVGGAYLVGSVAAVFGYRIGGPNTNIPDNQDGSLMLNNLIRIKSLEKLTLDVGSDKSKLGIIRKLFSDQREAYRKSEHEKDNIQPFPTEVSFAE